MRRVRWPAPSSGRAGSARSEWTRMSPSATSPSGSARNSTCQSRAGFSIGGACPARGPGTSAADADSASRALRRARGRSVPAEPAGCLRSARTRRDAGRRRSGRRERRVLQRLEVLPHVLEDGLDQIAGRTSRGFSRWFGRLGSHVVSRLLHGEEYANRPGFDHGKRRRLRPPPTFRANRRAALRKTTANPSRTATCGHSCQIGALRQNTFR